MKKKTLVLSLAALLPLMVANAATVTLTNADFNAGVWNTNGATKAPAGWATNFTAAGFYGDGAVISPSYGVVAFMQDRSGIYFQQELKFADGSSAQNVFADTYNQYSISYDAGFRGNASATLDYSYKISLWDVTNDIELVSSAQVLSKVTTAASTSDTLSSKNVTLDLSNYTGTLGSNATIAVRITNLGTGAATFNSTAMFDNFSITATPIPEPSTYGFASLAGLGAIVLVIRRRRIK